METLIALYLAAHASTGPIVPAYKIGNCYEIADPEARSGLIKITDIKSDEYEYQVLDSLIPDKKFLNDFDTVETVYDKGIECPNT